jgi:hypothetical protein
MSFEEQIKSNCGRLPYDRIKISHFDQLELATILRGVLFVFAAWSGDAIRSFRLLCDGVAMMPEAKFSLLVVDADGFDFDAFKRALGELPQGKGETYWIRNGQVIHRDHGYTDETKEVLQERIREFA